MDYIAFMLTVVAVSSSGVLSPGPLFFANMIYAKRYGYSAGIMIAHGHAIVEFPLIMLIALSILSIDIVRGFNWIISIVGGLALLIFASMQSLQLFKRDKIVDNNNKNKNRDYNFIDESSMGYNLGSRLRPLIIGIVFSALNPFFIAWWLTIGTKIISDAIMLAGLYGVLFMFITHIWMDYAWLATTAALTVKGVNILRRDSRYYLTLMLALSSLLVYIGVIFILEGINYL
jgi:threonine/homoserine/homoserine lactone efflux protein